MDYQTSDIAKAVEVMRRGGVILYPTDTVWGLGCDACRSEAVQRIFRIKGRADGKALISLLASSKDLDRYVGDIPDVAYDLVDLATTPVTVVFDKALIPPLAPELVAPDGSIGIRITHEHISASLCRMLRRPVVSTSANRSGQPTPATFAQISPEIIEAVDYVMTSRRDDNTPHHPSSVIKLGCDGTVKILRP
ncbi:MAG: threonylcarbamoyl-AMP synthase [Muribaculaceae bacterium]|nr:threonylcarbamoyl-AMP synthase [Muribaculaceae bacterium]